MPRSAAKKEKTQITGPHLTWVSNQISPGRGQQVCTSDKFPGDAAATTAGLGTMC